jgi:hypothetical protein
MNLAVGVGLPSSDGTVVTADKTEWSDMAEPQRDHVWALAHAELDGPGVQLLRSRLHATTT